MESLLRTRVSRFCLENSVRLSQVAEAVETGQLPELVLPIDRMFETFPAIYVKPEYRRLIENGNAVTEAMLEKPLEMEDGGKVRLYDAEGVFFAVYAYHGRRRRFEPVKMFYEKEEQQ